MNKQELKSIIKSIIKEEYVLQPHAGPLPNSSIDKISFNDTLRDKYKMNDVIYLSNEAPEKYDKYRSCKITVVGYQGNTFLKVQIVKSLNPGNVIRTIIDPKYAIK